MTTDKLADKLSKLPPYMSKIQQEYCESQGYKILQRERVFFHPKRISNDSMEIIEIEVGEWRTWTLPHIAEMIAEHLDRRDSTIREKMEGYSGEPHCDKCGRKFGAD